MLTSGSQQSVSRHSLVEPAQIPFEVTGESKFEMKGRIYTIMKVQLLCVMKEGNVVQGRLLYLEL